MWLLNKFQEEVTRMWPLVNRPQIAGSKPTSAPQNHAEPRLQVHSVCITTQQLGVSLPGLFAFGAAIHHQAARQWKRGVLSRGEV